MTWRGVQDSTCAAAQAASGCKPPPEACQVPSGPNPICSQSLRQKVEALIGGECRIRTRVGLHPNGFQDFSVKWTWVDFSGMAPCFGRLKAAGMPSFFKRNLPQPLARQGKSNSRPRERKNASFRRKRRDLGEKKRDFGKLERKRREIRTLILAPK